MDSCSMVEGGSAPKEDLVDAPNEDAVDVPNKNAVDVLSAGASGFVVIASIVVTKVANY